MAGYRRPVEPTTRWETAALRDGTGRPRPRVVEAGSAASPAAPGGREETDREESAERVAPGEETLIVPVSAWNRMLDQLGNLHEAGRELAEARERAARAETEAAFLRERLAEMRARASSGPPAPVEGAAAEVGHADGDGGHRDELPVGTRNGAGTSRADPGGKVGGLVSAGRRAVSAGLGRLRRSR